MVVRDPSAKRVFAMMATLKGAELFGGTSATVSFVGRAYPGGPGGTVAMACKIPPS